MQFKQIAISGALIAGLAAAPLSQAEAHRHGGWGLFWPFAAAAAVVGTAAYVATAPVRAIAAPPYYYAPPQPYYYPPPAPSYYAPSYYAPGYYYGSPYYR